jgi:hypothetical protein
MGTSCQPKATVRRNIKDRSGINRLLSFQNTPLEVLFQFLSSYILNQIHQQLIQKMRGSD